MHAQRSTMGKNIGYLCIKEILVLISLRTYVGGRFCTSPLHVSRSEMLHFNQQRVSAVNCMAIRTFTEKKKRNASGQQGENKRQRKKSYQQHIRYQSSIKRVTRMFLEVSRCSRAKERERNVQKKCATRAKLGFFC